MDEQRKYEVIKGLVDHPDTANKDRAALILGCTKRHINRMIQGYIKDGKAFFIHGNRGKKPATTIHPDIRSQVLDLYRTKYYEANFEHYTELLKKHEGISISSSSVMSILESEYILSPKATKAKRRRIRQALRAKKEAATSKKELSQIQANLVAVEDAHSRRPRCAYFGELLQMDATPYEWVPGQIWIYIQPLMMPQVLLPVHGLILRRPLAATTMCLNRFLPIMVSPISFLPINVLYLLTRKKGALSDDNDTYTQLAYACKQLGTQLESSSVPQAKGRIERLNQTLQSRLPIEFRLAGVTDINNANEFLHSYIKEFNEKFSLPLHGIKSVFETQPSKEKINLILAVLTERTVDAGHAIQFKKKFYKMIDHKGVQIHYRKGTKVMLIKAFDRSMFACVNDKDIYALEEIPAHEHKSKDLDADYKQPKPRKPYIPPMNHPWRLEAFNKFAHSQPHRIEDDLKSA